MKPKKAKPKKPEVGVVCAIKKGKRALGWMPDEVIISLDGSPTGQLLVGCGWSLTTTARDKACKKWPVARLEKNMGRIEEGWAEDFGKGWRFEIRSTVRP
jgi:hypothetical protein